MISIQLQFSYQTGKILDQQLIWLIYNRFSGKTGILEKIPNLEASRNESSVQPGCNKTVRIIEMFFRWIWLTLGLQEFESAQWGLKNHARNRG